MKSKIGERIRTLRKQQYLYLRKVAPLLELDTTQLSKIEKPSLQFKRKQMHTIAHILKANVDELLTLRLAD